MGFFYLEYTILALVIVYFARKITFEEINNENDHSDGSTAELKKGSAETLQRVRNVQKSSFLRSFHKYH